MLHKIFCAFLTTVLIASLSACGGLPDPNAVPSYAGATYDNNQKSPNDGTVANQNPGKDAFGGIGETFPPTSPSSTTTAPETAAVSTSAVTKAAPYIGKTTLNILFIGSSLTAVGDMPGQIQALVALQGVTVNPTLDLIGGTNITMPELFDPAMDYMRKNKYDYVVVQIQGDDDNAFIDQLIKVCDAACAADAVPVLYLYGFTQTVYIEIDGQRQGEYLSALKYKYNKMIADKLGGLFFDTYDAWTYLSIQHPEISLLLPNDFHPSAAGQYYSSCIFLDTILGLRVVNPPLQDYKYYDSFYLNYDLAKTLTDTAWEYSDYFNKNGEPPMVDTLDALKPYQYPGLPKILQIN